ncbi:hypothetical protein 162281024 [Organic Lake phycodnavirus]|nr:hypothetical protein 162281024 [Organic Lake phycodnavirus]
MHNVMKITKTMRHNILLEWNSNIRSQHYFPQLYENYNETLLCKDDKNDYYMLFGEYVNQDFVVKKIVEKPNNYVRYDYDTMDYYFKQYTPNND